MTYQEAVDWIHGQYYIGHKNGLENEKALLSRSGNPHQAYPCVHVAGTNGKGSTCAMLASVLQAAGLRVGLYTSPFLLRYNERMRVNGVEIPDETLAEIATDIKTQADILRDEGITATVFELGTACAFEYFARENVDIAVIEVGLGGRMDPTNVVTPLVSVITHIGMDHEKSLGDTIAQIAQAKAGIVKQGVPCVLYPQEEEIFGIIRAACEEKNAPLIDGRQSSLDHVRSDRTGHSFSFRHGGDQIDDMRVNLPGDHQLDNARTALLTLFALRQSGFTLTDEQIRRGLSTARWPGRLDWRGNVLLDGAHNPQGAQALAAYVKRWRGERKVVAICGILRGKDMDGIIGAMADIVDEAVCVTMPSHRETAPEEIQAVCTRFGVPAVTAPSVKDALESATGIENALIVIFGSLYLISEALSIFDEGGTHDLFV